MISAPGSLSRFLLPVINQDASHLIATQKHFLMLRRIMNVKIEMSHLQLCYLTYFTQEYDAVTKSGMETNLLADPALIRLRYVRPTADSITLVVRAISPHSSCPCCHRRSATIHSRYVRCVADLPWQGISVKLELHTRRFRCDNDLCPRRIFCERLPQVVAAYARKTVRLNDALRLIGFLIGGEAGARAAVRLGMGVSPDTLIRRVRQTVMPTMPTPRVLGVDAA